MISRTAWHGGASRHEERGTLRSTGRGEERGDEDIVFACERLSVCAVSVSSSLVLSDGAWAIGVGNLSSQAERMANSD